MYFLNDRTSTAEELLARDEGLLDAMEMVASEISGEEVESPLLTEGIEALRIWEFDRPVVVLGRSSRISEEVDATRCEEEGVRVLRRSSGGATILAGPGCLMYSVLIDYRSRPGWRMLDAAHQEVMSKLGRATQRSLDNFGINKRVKWQGTCDLTIDNKKFSGNALRCRKNFMIYHGTILLQMPLEQISKYLLQPPRQPEYRLRRDHLSFVCNLLDEDSSDFSAFRTDLIQSLVLEWGAYKSICEFPYHDVWLRQSKDLLDRKYSNPNWHRDRL